MNSHYTAVGRHLSLLRIVVNQLKAQCAEGVAADFREKGWRWLIILFIWNLKIFSRDSGLLICAVRKGTACVRMSAEPLCGA